MSASREKKSRQEKNQSGYVDPKLTREKEQASKDRKANTLYGIGAVVFVVVAALVLTLNSGILQRGAKAVTIDGETYTANDVAYYFGNAYGASASELSASGLDTSKSLREQEVVPGQSWFDYFAEIALNNMAGTAKLVKAAQADGFTADDKVDSVEQSTMDTIDMYASIYGTTRAQFIKQQYGKYMTEKDFRRNVRLQALADAYSESYAEANFSHTDAEIQAEYDADPDAYDTVDVEYVLFNTSLPSDASDAQKAEALSANQAKARTAAERAAAGESLEAIADEMDGTYTHSENATRNVNSDLMVWAFDAARQSGDTTTVDYSTVGAYAVLFNSRSRSEYHPVTVRHILVDDKETAEKLLEQFKSGEAAESDFAALAELNTKDSGSAKNGGLYENIYKGQMVQAFEDWCFDPARQSGDTGIVESTYGCHVMYFVETNPMPYWQFKADSALKSADIEAWNAELGGEAVIEQLDGMKYIG